MTTVWPVTNGCQLIGLKIVPAASAAAVLRRLGLRPVPRRTSYGIEAYSP